jgi:hypothetical protein
MCKEAFNTMSTQEQLRAQEPQPEETPNVISSPKNPNRRRNTIIGIGAGALGTAVLATSLFLLPKSERGGGTTDAPSNTNHTSQASETPKPTPSQTAETQPGTGEFTGKMAEQTHTVAEMDAITDLNVFAKLPYADRFAYALAKNPQLATSTPNNDPAYTTPKYIPGAFWQSIEGSAINNGNTLEGAKIISANQYYGTDLSTGEMSASYKAASDSVLQNGGKGKMLGEGDVYVDSGKWQTGTDRAGNPIDYINITDQLVALDGTTIIRGDVTNQTIRQPVKLSNGDVYITYPQGYGIEGHASPIDGGIY